MHKLILTHLVGQQCVKQESQLLQQTPISLQIATNQGKLAGCNFVCSQILNDGKINDSIARWIYF